MIAKRITSKAASSRVARLVRYVVAAEGGIDPRSWSRTADYMLASKTNDQGEKVGGVRVTNCGTNDPAVATTLIEATQAMNTRSKADKTYHLVFSFPPGEQPDLKTLHKIEEELVASIGFAEHQRISAVHIDTDHLHVHVAINKVHPKGFQNIEPFYDKLKLMEACERLELEHGLIRTNHGLTGEKTKKERLAEKQLATENHAGIETLATYVMRECSRGMSEAGTWDEMHEALSDHGLTIKKRGAGLVIGNGETWIKASQAGREFSMKALTERLGEFQPAREAPGKAYASRPVHKHPSTKKLYARYAQERQSRIIARSSGLVQVKHEAAQLNAQLKRWTIAQRMLVKATMKGPTRRAALKLIRIQADVARKNNRAAMNEKRRRILAATMVSPWAAWLSAAAQNGNSEALAVLRSRGVITQVHGDGLRPAREGGEKHGILKGFQVSFSKNGVVTYNTADGGRVVDRKGYIQSLRRTEKSSLVALDLAAKRFAGKALVVEGQEEFKKEVARLAGVHSLSVRFSDTEMEQIRQKHLTRQRGKTADKEMER